jgi:integrase
VGNRTVRIKRERYQHRSIRKVPRAKGFAWEFRYYENAPDGQRKLRVQTFDAVQYRTETAVRKAIEPQLASLNAGALGGKIDATLGTIIDRYLKEELIGEFAHILRPISESI